MRDYGWTNFQVGGQLCVEYALTCGRWLCEGRGNLEYKIQEYPDCTFNSSSRELCVYGCENGECLTTPTPDIGDVDLGGVTSGAGSILSSGLLMLDNLLPSPDLRLLGGMLITLAIGISMTTMVMSKSRGGDPVGGVMIGFIAMIFMSLFFMTRGWFPSWLALLIAIPSVAFILTLMLGKKGR